MGEYGPSAILGIHRTIHASDPEVQNGGIVGDRDHGSGYHRSRNALIARGRRNDYSIQDSRDKQGDGDAASALDLTPKSAAKQRVLTARLVAAMNAEDPRIKGYLREFGGSTDSRTVTAFRVEDKKRISMDSSHIWHVHLSIFRKYANDVAVCQGIAQVILGIPLRPFAWDGKSFPGAAQFYVGVTGAWIIWLGERLVAHGWKGYTEGPGPTFTEVDQAAVKWFQERQGWTGSDADGFPGPTTWELLAAEPKPKPDLPEVEQPETPNPVPPPVPEPQPEPPVIPAPAPSYPKPTNNLVYQEVAYPGRKDSDSVWQIQLALRKLGFDAPLNGAYDLATVAAAKGYQKSLGDTEQDGALGPLQINRLFSDADITISWVPIEEPAKSEPKPEPPKEAPVSTATETVFGLNILRETDKEPGRDRYPTRRPKLGKHLRDARASVYLLIETDSSTRRDMGAELGSDFAYWGFKYYGIYWDQRIWERVGDATNEAALGENRFLLSLPLRHKATGKVVNFDVSHLENDGDPKTDGHKARYSETTKIVARASKGNRAGFADLNSTTPGIIAKPTARQKQKPRYLLVQAGARLVTSLGSKVKNIAYGSHHGGKSGVKGPLIDEAWVFGDVEIVDAEIVRTDGTDATDHNGVKFRIKF